MRGLTRFHFYLVVYIIFFISLFFGLMTGEFRETLISAISLCLSCVGMAG